MKKTTRTNPARMVTIRIEADAHQRLKVRAAQSGISIKALVSQLSSPSAQGSR